MNDEFRSRGELALEQLQAVLNRVRDSHQFSDDVACRAFLHGQSAGLVLALKIIFPGDGSIGENSENLAKSVLGEKGCACDSDTGEEWKSFNPSKY